MNPTKRDRRLKALAERSSYVENVLTHALVAELSSVLWQRDAMKPLQVFNSEVDDLGFDMVLTVGSQSRYVQLKQAHDEKNLPHCSIRLSFAAIPGACVVLMSHSVASLQLRHFHFFGGTPVEPLSSIAGHRASVAPGRRSATGEKKVRPNYRDVPLKLFEGPLSVTQLFDVMFPEIHDA